MGAQCAVHGRPDRIAEGCISTSPHFLTLKLRHFSARREASTLFLREAQIWQCSKSFKLKLPRNSGVFTSARLKLKPQTETATRPTLRMVTATGRPTGRPTAAAADRPTADRRGTRCAPQIARLPAVCLA